MTINVIEEIKNLIKNGDYDLTYHAYEEMAEDNLSILDIEKAVLTGKITKIQKDNLYGSKYIIEGIGLDLTTHIGIVGRKKETGIFLVITVYVIND